MGGGEVAPDKMRLSSFVKCHFHIEAALFLGLAIVELLHAICFPLIVIIIGILIIHILILIPILIIDVSEGGDTVVWVIFTCILYTV